MAEARETPIAWSAVCLVIELDTATGTLRYANAGHAPPLVVGAGGGRRLAQTGPRLGERSARCDTVETVLGPDEMLVLHTGGVTGVRSAAGEQFGGQRLASLLYAEPVDPGDVEALADRAIEAVRQFSAHPERDVLGLIVVGRESVRNGVTAIGPGAPEQRLSNGSTPTPLPLTPAEMGSPKSLLNGGTHVFGPSNSG